MTEKRRKTATSAKTGKLGYRTVTERSGRYAEIKASLKQKRVAKRTSETEARFARMRELAERHRETIIELAK